MVRGIRGAVCAADNTQEAIREASLALITAILERNELEPTDIASIFMTTTPDLNADFPAHAVRESGLAMVPILCASEIDVPGALRHVVRMLLHVNTEKSQDEVQHVYLGDAKSLRPDLASPQ